MCENEDDVAIVLYDRVLLFTAVYSNWVWLSLFQAHTLPDIVFLPSDAKVYAMDEKVPQKPTLLVHEDIIDKARSQREPQGTRRQPVRTVAAFDSARREMDGLKTPPGKPTAPVRSESEQKNRKRAKMSLTYDDQEAVMQEEFRRRARRQGEPKNFDGFPETARQYSDTDTPTMPANASDKIGAVENTSGEQDALRMREEDLSALRAACTARLMWMFGQPGAAQQQMYKQAELLQHEQVRASNEEEKKGDECEEEEDDVVEEAPILTPEK